MVFNESFWFLVFVFILFVFYYYFGGGEFDGVVGFIGRGRNKSVYLVEMERRFFNIDFFGYGLV